MRVLREWIDRLFGTLRRRRGGRRSPGGAGGARRARRRCGPAWRRRVVRGTSTAPSRDPRDGRAARSARPAVAACALCRHRLRLAPAERASCGQRGRDPLARPRDGRDHRRLPAGGRRADAPATHRPAGAALVRDHHLRRRPASRRLLRQLGLPDLPALRRAGRRPCRPAGHRLEPSRSRCSSAARRSRSASTGSSIRATSSASSDCGRPWDACSALPTIACRAGIRSPCSPTTTGAAGSTPIRAVLGTSIRIGQAVVPGDRRRAGGIHRHRARPVCGRLRAGVDERRGARQAGLGLVPTVDPAAAGRHGRRGGADAPGRLRAPRSETT